MEKLGAWIFVLGFLIAVILGFMNKPLSSSTLTVLVMFGLIVGLLNITENEVKGFLLASIALLLVGSAANLSVIPFLGQGLQSALNNVVLFIAPATLVVAIKQIFLLAKD